MPFIDPNKIKILPRYREDLGDLESLAKDIASTGQIHPILVEECSETGTLSLLAGHRRLEACRLLKRPVWYTTTTEGEVQIESDLHRRRIELMENLSRKSFSTLEEARLIAEIDRLMKAIYGERTPGASGVQAKEKGEGWSQRDTARLLGFGSSSSISDAVQISRAAEMIPGIEYAKTTSEAKQHIKQFIQTKAREELARRGLIKLEQTIENPEDHFQSRVILGDCITNMKNLDSGIIDIILTDPPYRIQHDQGRKVSTTAQIIGTFDDSQDVYNIEEFSQQLQRVMKPNSWLIMFTSIEDFFFYQTILPQKGFFLYPRPLIWAKIQPEPFTIFKGTTIQLETWPVPSYEIILMARRGQVSLAKQGLPDILCYPPVKQSEKRHVTEKPIPLLEDLISRIFHPGINALLLDPFVGSGSTLVAAGRFQGLSSFGYEIDPTNRERAVSYLIEDYLRMEESRSLEEEDL